MSILIKGAKMPTNCWDCEVGGAEQMDDATCPFYSMEYWEQEEYRDKIAEGCPVGYVPPHGELIGREWLIDIAHHLMNTAKNDDVANGVKWLWQYIIEAPTVIPAESEGE